MSKEPFSPLGKFSSIIRESPDPKDKFRALKDGISSGFEHYEMFLSPRPIGSLMRRFESMPMPYFDKKKSVIHKPLSEETRVIDLFTAERKRSPITTSHRSMRTFVLVCDQGIVFWCLYFFVSLKPDKRISRLAKIARGFFNTASKKFGDGIPIRESFLDQRDFLEILCRIHIDPSSEFENFYGHRQGRKQKYTIFDTHSVVVHSRFYPLNDFQLWEKIKRDPTFPETVINSFEVQILKRLLLAEKETDNLLNNFDFL